MRYPSRAFLLPGLIALAACGSATSTKTSGAASPAASTTASPTTATTTGTTPAWTGNVGSLVYLGGGPTVTVASLGSVAFPRHGLASRPVPLAAPLPTSAVDATLFPALSPARTNVPGPVYHVAATGDDAAAGTAAAPFRTIAHGIAIAQVTSDAKVVVHGGAYDEAVPGDTVGLRISLPLVLEAAAGERVVVRPASGSIGDGLVIEAGPVTVVGISVEGFPGSGISLGKRGRTIADVVLSSVSVTMPMGGDGIAIYPDNTGVPGAPPVVDGLLVEDAAVTGADQGFTVSAGPVRSVALVGVSIQNRGGKSRSGADGIGVALADNFLVNGALVSGAANDGIDLHATRVAVLDAHVHDVARNGIVLAHGGDLVGCLVHDATDTSIVLDAAGSYRIVACTVADQGRAAGLKDYSLTVGFDHPTDAIDLELANTVFWGNTGGIVASAASHVATTACLLAPGTMNDTVASWGWDGSNTAGDVGSQDPVIALANLGPASGNLPFATNPAFASATPASLDDFRPGASSPLVDAGSTASLLPSTDLSGAPRVLGARPDVGALESR